MLFDLDDTLYPSTTGIWQAIGDRMDVFIMDRLGIARENVKTLRESLYLEYGTTLRGLRTLYGIDAESFLDYVHDVPIDRYLQRDVALKETMALYSSRKIIFTNASQAHAERVLLTLGLENDFDSIIDIMQITPYCKPLPEAYQKAVEISNIEDPKNCVVIDDSERNLKTASEMGFFTIQVGTDIRSPFADAAILTIADLPDVIPAEQPQREDAGHYG